MDTKSGNREHRRVYENMISNVMNEGLCLLFVSLMYQHVDYLSATCGLSGSTKSSKRNRYNYNLPSYAQREQLHRTAEAISTEGSPSNIV